MKKLLAIALSVVMLTGCDSLMLSMKEDSYKKAVEAGQLSEQIQLVDELYQYSPEKYASALDEKEYLLPTLQRLMADPRDLSGIADDTLQRAIAFAPNYEPLSYAKRYLADRQKVKATIEESEKAAKAVKASLDQKLATMPKHIETYQTTLSFKGIEPYFLTSNYARQLVAKNSRTAFSGYHLESIVRELTDLFIANQAKYDAMAQLDRKQLSTLSDTERQFIKENGDIQRMLLWLYKKQLTHSYFSATESNDYLQSLLNSKYGRERLDDVWIRLVEPAAKKAVMQAKKSYLLSLDLIAAKIDKTAGDKPRLKKIYSETLALDKTLLSLMWPPNGLDNFKATSKEARIELQQQIKRIQQL
ncbi:hypothetical protein ACFSJY_02560 [Thalassotalea euphylliae]|uniref:hypothetical protein n=1 Tax=Thalassotalea euphylliae TaxID=1655234 RepID=UPI00362E1B8E